MFGVVSRHIRVSIWSEASVPQTDDVRVSTSLEAVMAGKKVKVAFFWAAGCLHFVKPILSTSRACRSSASREQDWLAQIYQICCKQHQIGTQSSDFTSQDLGCAQSLPGTRLFEVRARHIPGSGTSINHSIVAHDTRTWNDRAMDDWHDITMSSKSKEILQQGNAAQCFHGNLGTHLKPKEGILANQYLSCKVQRWIAMAVLTNRPTAITSKTLALPDQRHWTSHMRWSTGTENQNG